MKTGRLESWRERKSGQAVENKRAVSALSVESQQDVRGGGARDRVRALREMYFVSEHNPLYHGGQPDYLYITISPT